MKTKTTTSVDGRITLHHNPEWVGVVEIEIRNGGLSKIPVDLLLTGDFDRSTHCCGDIGERDMRRATAMAVALAARWALDVILPFATTIKDVDHG